MKIIELFKNEKFGCRLIALLFVVVLLRLWPAIYGGFYMAVDLLQGSSLNDPNLTYLVLLLLCILVNVIAAIGLFRLAKWGFIVAYIAIPFSTIAFSTSYIPYVSRLFPMNFGVIVVNSLLLLYLIYLNLKFRQQRL